MKQSRNEIYEDIIREAESKKKQQLNIINKRCCPECGNSGEGCLNLAHILKDGIEIYKCINYLKNK